ncbi:MAG: hypothetical protein ACT4PU_08865 [Planctomycetota bacterium]
MTPSPPAGPDDAGDAAPLDEVGGGEGRAGARKPFLLRLPPELMAELRGWSAQELRSLNAHIEYLLREAVKKRKGR